MYVSRMTFARAHPIEPLVTLPRMPAWVTSGRVETPEDVAFLSGAALAHLHQVLARDEVPRALLRERLALRAAEACVRFSGRSERARDLRDAVHLLRPGDLPGPAGGGYLALEMVLTDAPRGELSALILADAALAQALGWDYLVPLLAQGLSRAALGKRGEDLRLACHRAIVSSAAEAVQISADLARRTAHLKAVAPKLRAKAAKEAVEIFLTRDAVTPSALLLPNRAARRLCDRLIDLGAVRELSGRETFRLYGV